MLSPPTSSSININPISINSSNNEISGEASQPITTIASVATATVGEAHARSLVKLVCVSPAPPRDANRGKNNGLQHPNKPANIRSILHSSVTASKPKAARPEAQSQLRFNNKDDVVEYEIVADVDGELGSLNKKPRYPYKQKLISEVWSTATLNNNKQRQHKLAKDMQVALDKASVLRNSLLQGLLIDRLATVAYVADTGAGLHLKRFKKSSAVYTDGTTVKLLTANGEVDEERKQDTDVIGLGQITSTVLDNTPEVLSVGLLIKDLNVDFVWRHTQRPYFEFPDGRKLYLIVKDNVPLFNEDDIKKQLMKQQPNAQNKGAESTCIEHAIPGVPLPATDPSGDVILRRPRNRLREKTQNPAAGEVVSNELLAETNETHETTKRKHNILTHNPADPVNCEACRIAKQKRAPAITGSAKAKEKPVKFGAKTTFDNLVSGTKGLSIGIGGQKYGLPIRDVGTNFCTFTSSSSKYVSEVTFGLREHFGKDIHLARELYSDSAPEYKRAAKLLRLPIRTSTPRRPTANCEQEAFMRVFGDGIRTNLFQAGLSQNFWPYAGGHLAIAINHKDPHPDTGIVPYKARYPTLEAANIEPFGCLCHYVPAKTTAAKEAKFGPRGQPAVFLGYYTPPGGVFTKDYLIAPLDWWTDKEAHKTFKVIRTRDVRFEPAVSFPIRELVNKQRELAFAQINPMQSEEEYIESIFGPAELDNAELIIEDDNANEPVANHEFEIETLPKEKTIEIDDSDEPSSSSSSSSMPMSNSQLWQAVRGLPAVSKPNPDKPCILIEFACQKESMLGQVGARLGVKVIRLHKDYADLLTPAGKQRAFKDARENPGAHLHGSLPCTPWSRWQTMNIHRYGKKFESQLLLARKTSLQFLGVFIELATLVHNQGGEISFEWPRYCDGWDIKILKEFEARLKMQRVSFDGCAVGVLSSKGGRIKKPWRITTTNLDLVKSLKSKMCTKTHKHDECAGAETVKTGFYPPLLCNIMLKTLPDYFVAVCDKAHEVISAMKVIDKHAQEVPKVAQDHSKKIADVNSYAAKKAAKEKSLQHKNVVDHMNKQIDKAIAKAQKKLGLNTQLVSETFHALSAIEAAAAINQDDMCVDDLLYISANTHRPKHECFTCPWLALVVRQIHPWQAEFRSEGCKAALNSELTKLRQKGVWDESTVKEWSQVVADAAGTNDIPMLGDLFAIMGQKNSELGIAAGPEAPYKARIVFGGHNIRTASGQPAHTLFQEVATTPSTMASARTALGIGALRGNRATIRDAEKAYIQSRIKQPGRNSTWVSLPKDWWPPEWFDKNGLPLFKKPVVELILSLYGHPESGALWDKHLKKALVELGYVAVDNNPGVWFHKPTKAILIVYVDDLLLVACPKVDDKLWEELGNKIDFQDPQAPINRYLGTYHDVNTIENTTTFKASMTAFLEDAAYVYMQEVGVKHLPNVETPFLEEKFNDPDGAKGDQAGTAASHLMKVLFAARMCRPDLTVGITKLASNIANWKPEHDKHLKRLMSYIAHHANYELVSQLSTEDFKTAVLDFSPDADLAGDLSTSKSTSGMWLELVSKDGSRCWPLAWSCKKQTATSSSTCESEVVSMSSGLRKEAIPILDFLELALERPVQLICKEDNSQAIIAAQKGYSPALRHLARHHRIALGFVNETFYPEQQTQTTPRIQYQVSADHKGDFMTKILNKEKFQHALKLAGLRAPNNS